MAVQGLISLVTDKNIHLKYKLIFLLFYNDYTNVYFNDVLLFIGEKLGQPNYAVPYLAPNANGDVLLNGVNYASCGGAIHSATRSVYVSHVRLFVACYVQRFKLPLYRQID